MFEFHINEKNIHLLRSWQLPSNKSVPDFHILYSTTLSAYFELPMNIYISTSEYSTFAVEELPNYSKSYIGTASPALQGPDNDNYAEKK